MIFDVPLAINWNFTDLCNFNCRHCYSRGRLPDEMSASKKEAVAKVLCIKDVPQVNLGGGEPLLLRDDIIHVARVFQQYKTKLCISTNAYDVNTSYIKELHDLGVFYFYVSLDSHDATVHNYIRNNISSFAEALKFISLCSKIKQSVGVSLVLNRLNWQDIPNTLKFFLDLGITRLSIKRLRPVGNGLTNMNELVIPNNQETDMLALLASMIMEYKDKINIHFVYNDFPIESSIDTGCPCGRTSLAIMPNGDMKMCVYGYRVIGNIITDDLSDVWINNSYLNEMRKHHVCEGLEIRPVLKKEPFNV